MSTTSPTGPASATGVPDLLRSPSTLPTATPEREALRRAVTAFTEAEIAPHLDAWEDAGELPRELHRAAAKAGVLGVGFPESVGGEGGGLVDTLVVTEGIFAGGGSGGLIAGLFTHGIALPHIVDAGDADLVDTWVRPTLAGELIGSLGITEPGGGSDVGGLTTRAVRDGDHYVVNGAKTFITSGTRADFVTTAVRTGGPGAGGISLLVVPTDTPGFTVDRRLAKLGWHCSDTAELSYADVRVPVTNLVGPEHGGFVQIAAQFVVERIGLAAQGYAAAARALTLAAAYATQRETFGRPLAARQVIRHKLVEMHRQVVVAQLLAHDVAARYDAAGPDGRFGLVADACLAKDTAVRTAEHVCHEAVQIFGGAGYLRYTEVERHYRDARLLGIGGGANEVLVDLAAKLLGYAR